MSERSPIACECGFQFLPYPRLINSSGTSASTGSFLFVGGSVLLYPSRTTCIAGRNLSDPITFVGLTFRASTIVWPMAVIACDTVEPWTCRPYPKNPVRTRWANHVRHWTLVWNGVPSRYGSTPIGLMYEHQFRQHVSRFLEVASTHPDRKALSATEITCMTSSQFRW